MFFGIIISLYFKDQKRHRKPHIHARYQDQRAVLDIHTGRVLAGTLPPGKLRLVQAWVEIHRDDLLADWQIAVQGGKVFRIAPLK
jgi:hypothetical protein